MLLQILPVVAYAAAIATVLAIALGQGRNSKGQWVLPALLSALFFLFSLVTVIQDGLLQFWVNHTTNLAGNQVWVDLLFAIAIGFFLIAPRARAVGMPLLPWALAVLTTACVALLPMLARLLWLEHRARSGTAHEAV